MVGLKIKRFRSFWDKIFFRKFYVSNVPMVQNISLLDYNSHYLSVTFQINNQYDLTDSVHFVSAQGAITHHRVPLDYDQVWLKEYIEHLTKFEKRPWFIINGDTNILSQMKFTGRDLKYLSSNEVSFYFYEPLFARSLENNRCPAFFDEDTQVYFPELEWLTEFCTNNSINRPVVYVCDYRLRQYLEKFNLYPPLKVKTWDIFLADTCRSLTSIEKKLALQIDRGRALPPLKSKFICLNFRYEGFRELVVGFLFGSYLADTGNISFYHRHQRDLFLKDLPFSAVDLPQWKTIEWGISQMQERLPLVLDAYNSKVVDVTEHCLPDADGKSNQRRQDELLKWYQESFLAIVNETRFGTYCGEVSEKTFIPIQHMRPFVIVGGPKMLQYLHELGFESFGDIWDESYDDIEDHGLRMERVLQLIETILSRPLNELQELLDVLKPRLLRNRQHLLENLLPQMHRELELDQKS